MHPNPTPLISVNVIAFNAEAFLAQTLDSVRAQTFDDWECVVVDDASTDQTAGIAQRYAEMDARFRLVSIRPQDKRPFPYPRNVGLEASRGQWVAVLDSDDLWVPDKLALQIEAVQAKPQTVLCFGRAMTFRGDQAVAEMRTMQQYESYRHHILKSLLHSDVVPHSAAMFDRQAALDLGGYDLNQPRAQDWDLMLRLVKRHGSERVVALPQVLLHYRVHDGNIMRQGNLLVRSERRVVRKTLLSGGWGLAHPILALHMIDGMFLREMEHAMKSGRRMQARLLGLLVVLAKPISRWRWERVKQAWRQSS